MPTHYAGLGGRPVCESPEDLTGGIVTCEDCRIIAIAIGHPVDGHGYWYSMRDRGCDCRARFTSRAEWAAHVNGLRATHA